MKKIELEIFLQLIDELQKYDLQSVADNSGVSVQTLNNWINMNVSAPQMRTFVPVANVIGFEIILRKKRNIRLVG